MASKQEPIPGDTKSGNSFLGSLRRLALNKRFRVLLQALVLGLVAIFLGRALWDEWPDIVNYPWQIQPLYLLGAILVLLARGPIITLAWRAILRRMGYPLPLLRSLRIYFYSGLAKYIPGSIWYAVGRVMLAQQAGVPKMVTTVSIALETALITVSSILIGALAFTASPVGDLTYVLLVLAGLLVFIIWPTPWFALMNKGLVLLGRNPVTMKISGRDLIVLMPPFLLSWIAYGFISFFFTAALYPDLSWSQWPTITASFTLSWVIGFLAFLIPNGWGIRETILIKLLTTPELAHLPLQVALGAAILSRLGSIFGEAAWAAIAWRIKDQG